PIEPPGVMRVTGLHTGWLAALPETTRKDLAAALSPAEARALLYDWSFWARPTQLPPVGNWRVWLLLAGRGFGTTRTGAELVRARVAGWTARRLALVAPTAADARNVMVEGESGILAISPPWDRALPRGVGHVDAGNAVGERSARRGHHDTEADQADTGADCRSDGGGDTGLDLREPEQSD